MSALALLMFAYYFPPYLAAGSSRSGQLAKYLVRAGVDLTVVAGAPGDLPELVDLETGGHVVFARGVEVNALPARLLGRRRVREHGAGAMSGGPLRVLGGAYKQLVNFPDAQVGWIAAAIDAAERSGARPDIVFSSSSPPSAHLAAAIYARRHGLPHVLEFRDPWAGNPMFRRWWPARAVERGLQEWLMGRAAAVTAITETFAGFLSHDFGMPVEYVPNGYDPDDFASPSPPIRSGVFAHVGTVYPSYDLAPFLRGLRDVARECEAIFAGRNLGPLAEAAARERAEARVKMPGPVRRSVAIELIRAAEANVLFFWRPSWRLASIYVPQKLYEYLAARRPIVAVGEATGEAAAILRSSGLGVFVRREDEVRAALEGGADGAGASLPAVERFSYARIAERYLELFARVRSPGPGA